MAGVFGVFHELDAGKKAGGPSRSAFLSGSAQRVPRPDIFAVTGEWCKVISAGELRTKSLGNTGLVFGSTRMVV